MDLTEAFLEGYNAQDPQLDNPFLYSSPSWLAFKAGGDFAKYETIPPTQCRASRGYKLRVFGNNHEWLATPDKTLTSWHFKLVSIFL